MAVTLVDSETARADLGARFRKQREGPESKLVDAFLDVLPLRMSPGSRATIFREPSLASGFPDLVIVVWRESVALHWPEARMSLETSDLRLMHLLHQKGGASQSEVVDVFGRRSSWSLERLYEAGMIRRKGESWIPYSLRRSFAASKIIAIEAKIGRWSDVMNQAVLNTWFASKSYVLVSTPPSEAQLDSAQRWGIGVCSISDADVHEVESDVSHLPRSYASWVLNDWAWRATR